MPWPSKVKQHIHYVISPLFNFSNPCLVPDFITVSAAVQTHTNTRRLVEIAQITELYILPSKFLCFTMKLYQHFYIRRHKTMSDIYLIICHICSFQDIYLVNTYIYGMYVTNSRIIPNLKKNGAICNNNWIAMFWIQDIASCSHLVDDNNRTSFYVFSKT